MQHEETSAIPAELRVFMRDGRLAQIPVKRAKRLLLLDHIAQSFEPGRRYSEPEVDAVLRCVHDDHAALRRYLVDEDFLSRKDGVYWRTGGTVPLVKPEKCSYLDCAGASCAHMTCGNAMQPAESSRRYRSRRRRCRGAWPEALAW